MRSFLLAIAAACGGGGAVVANQPTHAHETLAEALVREVGAGRSVAIVGGEAGVRAVSSDGARERTLVPARASWVVVDHRADVVWFGNATGTEMLALDLDQPASPPPQPRVVVTKLPPLGRVEMVGPLFWGVVYVDPGPDTSPGEAFFSGERYSIGDMFTQNASITLEIGPTVELVASSGYVQNHEWEADVMRATIDAAYVATLRARTRHVPEAPKAPAEQRVAGVDPTQCETPEDCGKAEPIPGTHYWRVMVFNMMGDVRHIGYRLYDAGAKRFVDAEWGTWLQFAWVAPDATAFVVNGVVVRFDGGPAAATPKDRGALGGGWLGGGTHYML